MRKTRFQSLIRYWRRGALLVGGLLVTSAAILWMQPRWMLNSLSPAICPDALFYVPTDQPVVALTIDDGPDNQRRGEANTTRKILNVLAKHGAKATFFLISRRISPQNQGLIAEMVRQGHELGNHLTEDQPSIALSLPGFTMALKTAEQDILTAAQLSSDGDSLQWMRPGSGRCTPAMAEVAAQQGYRIALGAPWPYDTSLPSSQFAVQQILANVRPGSIIVLHDYGPNGDWGNRTVVTLSQVLPKLKQKGYTVVTLTELSGKISP